MDAAHHQRACVLSAALGFLAVEPRERELRLLHRWLDTWDGIGHAMAGMARQEYDLELRRYDGEGWRAVVFVSGFRASFTPPARSTSGPTPRAPGPRGGSGLAAAGRARRPHPP